MSDKPDRSMRPDDHRRKWDSVEYEKNAQARLELEEAIEKSRERKDRLMKNVIALFESFLGTDMTKTAAQRSLCSIVVQGRARARERQTESA